MPSSERVVRKRLADGTVREYRYGPRAAKAARFHHDTLGALIIAYKRSPEWLGLAETTRRTYSVYLRDLEADPHTRARDVTRRNILAVRDAIASTRGNGASVGFIRSASALFSWAVDREWIDHSPVTRIKALAGGHWRAWTADDAARAMAGLAEPLRRAVVLALHTGQRRGDLVALQWSDYDGATIRLRQQKTGEALAIPAHPDLKAELDQWRRSATATTILTTAGGIPWHPARLTERLGRALAAIDGLPPGLGIHGVRKLAATRLADAGCSTHEIAAITGHRTLAMVALYTRTADQEKLATAAIHRLKPRSANRAKPAVRG
jgi:integrase